MCGTVQILSLEGCRSCGYIDFARTLSEGDRAIIQTYLKSDAYKRALPLPSYDRLVLHFSQLPGRSARETYQMYLVAAECARDDPNAHLYRQKAFDYIEQCLASDPGPDSGGVLLDRVRTLRRLGRFSEARDAAARLRSSPDFRRRGLSALLQVEDDLAALGRTHNSYHTARPTLQVRVRLHAREARARPDHTPRVVTLASAPELEYPLDLIYAGCADAAVVTMIINQDGVPSEVLSVRANFSEFHGPARRFATGCRFNIAGWAASHESIQVTIEIDVGLVDE